MQARAQLTAEIGSRTEAEMFLRRSIEDAKVEIDKKRQAVLLATGVGASKSKSSGARPDLEDLVDMYTSLSKEDREQILASLLAQEHVLTALQRISFPSAASPTLSAMDDTRIDHGFVPVEQPEVGFTSSETRVAVSTWQSEAKSNQWASADAKLPGLDDRLSARVQARPSARTPVSPERYRTSALGKAAMTVVAPSSPGTHSSASARSKLPVTQYTVPVPEEPAYVPTSHGIMMSVTGAKPPMVAPAPARNADLFPPGSTSAKSTGGGFSGLRR